MKGLASLGEWVAAGLALMGLFWLVSGPARSILGAGVSMAPVAADILPDVPPGVPIGATPVPLLVLLDGTEVRVGTTQSALNAVLSERLVDGPPHVSRGDYGDRVTRTYVHRGTKFYVTCERTEPGGPIKVAGIYLP